MVGGSIHVFRYVLLVAVSGTLLNAFSGIIAEGGSSVSFVNRSTDSICNVLKFALTHEYSGAWIRK